MEVGVIRMSVTNVGIASDRMERTRRTIVRIVRWKRHESKNYENSRDGNMKGEIPRSELIGLILRRSFISLLASAEAFQSSHDSVFEQKIQ